MHDTGAFELVLGVMKHDLVENVALHIFEGKIYKHG